MTDFSPSDRPRNSSQWVGARIYELMRFRRAAAHQNREVRKDSASWRSALAERSLRLN